MKDEIANKLREALDNKKLGEYESVLSLIREGRFLEERHLEVKLKDKDGKITNGPVVEMIYFAGRGDWIKPWGEIRYLSCITFDKKQTSGCKELEASKEEADLFETISKLIPPGGRLMIEYGFDRSQHPSTAMALREGKHPVDTPLGRILWDNGFRAFKDWYFPEGGKEGEMKLQGQKPLNATQEKQMIERIERQKKSYKRKE